MNAPDPYYECYYDPRSYPTHGDFQPEGEPQGDYNPTDEENEEGEFLAFEFFSNKTRCVVWDSTVIMLRKLTDSLKVEKS